MPYLVVSDFKAGLDRRRSIVTAPAGALWTANNVHITRGGEIEKRKAFKVRFALPGGTAGYFVLRTAHYVFGGTAAPVGIPAGVTYQRLQHPVTPALAMTRLVAATAFAGKIFAIAEYEDGSRALFYDGTVIPEWHGAGIYAALANSASDCVTMKQKVIVAAGSSLVFSKLLDASTFTGTGSGIIDVSADQTGLEEIIALSKYQSQLAVYARRVVQTWTIDVDLANCAGDEPLENTGIIAPKSAVPFGGNDSFVLNDTGVRSIRSRSVNNSPGIYDIGTPIDTIVTAAMKSLGDTTVARAQGVIEPIDGRYILAVGSTAYVFSYFPSSEISAWSTYGMGGEVVAWGTVGPRLFCRILDSIYEYGASDLGEYDDSACEVVLPYLHAEKPAHLKTLTGLDASIEGVWRMDIGMNLNSPDTREHVANLRGPTFSSLTFPAVGKGTHFGVRLTCQADGAARIGNLLIHFKQHGAD
jgi:hypothetical protein